MALLVDDPGIRGVAVLLPGGIEEAAQVDWDVEYLCLGPILSVNWALVQVLVQDLHQPTALTIC